MYFMVADVNECNATDTVSCNQNAVCHNTEGSYECICNLGYTGDGVNCTGKTNPFIEIC